MDIVTTIPVRLKGPDSIPLLLEDVRERIARRAHEKFVGRGAVHGHDVSDWLDAERELIRKPPADVRLQREDVFVELNLSENDLPNLTVHLAPRQIIISSDADPEGFRLCRVIDLPILISLDGVDAELFNNVLRITAAVA
jgi:hypothetical protein